MSESSTVKTVLISEFTTEN